MNNHHSKNANLATSRTTPNSLHQHQWAVLITTSWSTQSDTPHTLDCESKKNREDTNNNLTTIQPTKQGVVQEPFEHGYMELSKVNIKHQHTQSWSTLQPWYLIQATLMFFILATQWIYTLSTHKEIPTTFHTPLPSNMLIKESTKIILSSNKESTPGVTLHSLNSVCIASIKTFYRDRSTTLHKTQIACIWKATYKHYDIGPTMKLPPTMCVAKLLEAHTHLHINHKQHHMQPYYQQYKLFPTRSTRNSTYPPNKAQFSTLHNMLNCQHLPNPTEIHNKIKIYSSIRWPTLLFDLVPLAISQH